MTKIERYAQSKGLCICAIFDDDIGFNGVYAIFDVKLRYQYVEFELTSEVEVNIDEQFRFNYRKIKKYIDVVYKYKEERKIQYYPKLVLKF